MEMNETLTAVERAKTTAIDLVVNFGPKILAAILVLAVGFVVSRWLAQWMARGLGRIEIEPPVRSLIVRIARIFILGLFLIMALENLGVELLPLIAGLGLAGAGIALAMQGVLSNVAAGLTIIFTKPFRVDEYISIAGEEGVVETISLFNTTLGHLDRSRVVIPNRKIVGEILHNYGRIRQLNLTVNVGYGADLDAALGALREVLAANERVLREPGALIRIDRLDASWVVLGVMPWVNAPEYALAEGEINRAVLEKFRERAIAVPVAKREVHLVDARPAR